MDKNRTILALIGSLGLGFLLLFLTKKSPGCQTCQK